MEKVNSQHTLTILEVLPKLINYVNERYFYWNRWIGALRRVHESPSSLPAFFLWGDKDPIARPPIAIAGFKDVQQSNTLQEQDVVKLKWLNGLGHYPMLENAKLWSTELMHFITSVDEQKPNGKIGKLEFKSMTEDAWKKEGIRTTHRVSLSKYIYLGVILVLLSLLFVQIRVAAKS
jgi:hypothetical protein